MTHDGIKEVVEKFAQTGRRVKGAGFDAVQLYGCHGILINNFVSQNINIRTDEYGGNTENRARFIVEIVKRARELVGSEYPLMIKMNSDDFFDGSLKKDEAISI